MKIKFLFVGLAFVLLSHSGSSAQDLSPSQSEGYKGVPWDSTFQQFATIKSQDNLEEPEASTSVGDVGNVYIQSAVDYILIDFHDEDLSEGQNVISGTKIDNDDTNYVFYKGKYCLGFSEIDPSNVKGIKKTIDKKYKYIGEHTRAHEESGGGYMERFKYYEYQKNPKTRIYIIEVVPDVNSQEVGIDYSALVYVSEKYFQHSAYGDWLNSENKEKLEENKAIEDQKTKDSQKVE